MRWSEEQFANFQAKHGITPQHDPPPSKRSKFGNEKVQTPDGTFDSKQEYQRWCELKMLEKAGVVTNLQRQVAFVLAPSVILGGKTKPALRYMADFVYYRAGSRVVEDFKSPITAREDLFRAKLHLMKSVHNIEVQIVLKGKKQKP